MISEEHSKKTEQELNDLFINLNIRFRMRMDVLEGIRI